jgi:RimJ/RimL family protein N-acetyltransferase
MSTPVRQSGRPANSQRPGGQDLAPAHEVVLLKSDDWAILKGIRLAALSESPDSFLSTYETEQKWPEKMWRAEFDRGEWTVCSVAAEAVGLLGVTRDPQDGRDYLGYMWVARGYRNRGFAQDMANAALRRLQRSQVTTAFLWVLDNNFDAMKLYQKLGFVGTGRIESLDVKPGRSEVLMQIGLAGRDLG